MDEQHQTGSSIQRAPEVHIQHWKVHIYKHFSFTTSTSFVQSIDENDTLHQSVLGLSDVGTTAPWVSAKLALRFSYCKCKKDYIDMQLFTLISILLFYLQTGL